VSLSSLAFRTWAWAYVAWRPRQLFGFRWEWGVVATWLRYRTRRSGLFSTSACPFFLSFPLFIIVIFLFVLVLVFAANGNREDRLAGEKG
jgi:hypothetical protein